MSDGFGTFSVVTLPMLDRPVAFYRITAPCVIAGLPGLPDDLLIFWPGHPTHTLSVRANGRGRRQVRRHTYCEDGIVYGLLLEALNADLLIPLSFFSASVLPSRPLPGQPVPRHA